MTYPTQLLPTTVVGSYPQPEWLVDRGALGSRQQGRGLFLRERQAAASDWPSRAPCRHHSLPGKWQATN